ncbi:hypothetical protein [Methylobacter sp.]|jgi:hypothetical protein|uniref:hypothetical protein n=1 Tax=Methylobacter sp. TaxID=2051955 RepID=UPI003DA5A3AC
MQHIINLPHEMVEEINHLPNPDQFIYDAIRRALEARQKPSKWAQLAERIAENPIDLEEHTEQFKQDMEEFKQDFAFKSE